MKEFNSSLLSRLPTTSDLGSTGRGGRMGRPGAVSYQLECLFWRLPPGSKSGYIIESQDLTLIWSDHLSSSPHVTLAPRFSLARLLSRFPSCSNWSVPSTELPEFVQVRAPPYNNKKTFWYFVPYLSSTWVPDLTWMIEQAEYRPRPKRSPSLSPYRVAY